MADYSKDAEGRRDYGHDGERKYSSEGRVLRPRKKAASSSNNQRTFNSGEHRSHGESRGNYGERRSYGENRGGGNGERRSYGESRGNYGEHRGYGENRGGGNGERRSYGESRGNYGEHRSYGENRGGYGERRSYGESHSNYGEHRSYGENRGGSYGERKSYGENRGGYGDRRSNRYQQQGEHRSYGEGHPHGDGFSSFSERKPGFGGKPNKSSFSKSKGSAPHKQFKKKYEVFNEEEGSGISKMINSKPQVDNMQYSDFDAAPAMTKDEIRLNKFIANSGVCSRREADTLIQAGVVTVNGVVVTELGTKVNVLNDDVRFNGERLKGEEKVYVVMNKPKGFVTTASDPHAEKTVMDLLKGCESRIFPVGRLDKATTGVLLFTNDGEIAERLTHPSYDKKKIYQVLLDHEINDEDCEKIRAGVELSDGPVHADELEYIDENDHRKVGIEIHSGKNRIVRRIFESLGYDVRALDRVYFAGLTKKGLKKGEWRYLSEGEVNILKMGAYV